MNNNEDRDATAPGNPHVYQVDCEACAGYGTQEIYPDYDSDLDPFTPIGHEECGCCGGTGKDPDLFGCKNCGAQNYYATECDSYGRTFHYIEKHGRGCTFCMTWVIDSNIREAMEDSEAFVEEQLDRDRGA